MALRCQWIETLGLLESAVLNVGEMKLRAYQVVLPS